MFVSNIPGMLIEFCAYNLLTFSQNSCIAHDILEILDKPF